MVKELLSKDKFKIIIDYDNERVLIIDWERKKVKEVDFV